MDKLKDLYYEQPEEEIDTTYNPVDNYLADLKLRNAKTKDDIIAYFKEMNYPWGMPDKYVINWLENKLKGTKNDS